MANENETVEQVCDKIASVAKEMHGSDYGEVWSMAFEVERYNKEVLAAHKRETDELKKQVRIAKDAFFKIARRNHSQEIYDIVCEAEFMMNHPECRKVTKND